ncbi:hypothetical protein SISNIDRAFT_547558 [Sistotremastrum niveocremeum HHB9708]|uniref:Translation initiation factor IF2/IF5 domain-containing protein n=1 Tax=Sistotremastrum niveocremeum HHB9708 TaxID=1314777 RepID=A0A164YFC6_9AGAM|nr:hypothetical protein SISNIDRAFT_547558 [Sistotremastrum niveocremeum HHB9708]
MSASTEPLFDPSLKKKKKKKTVAFSEDPLGADADPTTPAPPLTPSQSNGELGPATVHEQMKANGASGRDEDAEDIGQKASAKAAAEEEDPLAMFGDLKKKKKKKKEIPFDLEENQEESTPASASAPEPSAEPALDDFDLSDLKKKKKSSKKKVDLEAFEKELENSKGGDADDDDIAAALDDDADLGDDPFAPVADVPSGVDTGSEPWLGSDRDYKYNELLTRFFNALHAANPALASNTGKRYTIAPPQILREGNKKSIFANITDICKRMHRQPEHVIAFLFAELGTTGSVDGSGRLVIRGRFLPKQMENVLRRYIVEYVTCKTCKSPDTLLTKENRIYFMACESCGSRRSVSAIKSGFQAQVGRRSKNKTG